MDAVPTQAITDTLAWLRSLTASEATRVGRDTVPLAAWRAGLVEANARHASEALRETAFWYQKATEGTIASALEGAPEFLRAPAGTPA